MDQNRLENIFVMPTLAVKEFKNHFTCTLLAKVCKIVICLLLCGLLMSSSNQSILFYHFQLIRETFQNQKFLSNRTVKSKRELNLKLSAEQREHSPNFHGKRKAGRYASRFRPMSEIVHKLKLQF